MRAQLGVPTTLVFLACCSCVPLFAQAVPPPGIPSTVTVCDKVQQYEACADWIWNGTDFSYKYSKASGTGTITRNGPTSIILRRKDSHASWPLKPGEVEYVGALNTDHSAFGTSTYRGKGQSPFAGTWTATFSPASTVVPIIDETTKSRTNIALGQTLQRQLTAPAISGWVDSGIYVNAGQVLDVSASGQWSNGGEQPRFVGPEGFQSLDLAGTLLPSANLASLIGKVDSTVFYIGSRYSGVSPASGELFLSMNELPNSFADNVGSLRVSVEVKAAPAVIPVSALANEVCGSSEVRAAMQIVENKEVNDPVGILLGGVACGVTGVCPDLSSMRPTILKSRPATDSAGYTSNDPGSFLCQGLFARGNVRLEVGRDGDLASVLTKEEMDRALAAFPNYQENFKVRPLQDKHFLLILLPAIQGFSQEYSTAFSFSH